jgi:protein involved in polysaccharide export with SLBB domain
MQDNGKITLLQALAQAGGMNYTAKMSSAYLMHKGDKGYAPNRINIGDLVKGKQADIQMSRNDILYIPTSQLKHFSQDTQAIAQAAAGAAVYHVVP